MADTVQPEGNRLRALTIASLAVFACTVAVLQVFAGGNPPELHAATPLQKKYLLPLLFCVANAAPFYILARLAGARGRTRTDHAVYLGGGIVIFALALSFRTYAYSLALSSMQVALAGIAQLVAWMARDRIRRPRAFAVLGALAASFLVNWAIAPWAHMVDADDYYGPDMPADVRGQLEHFYRIWEDPALRNAAQQDMRRQNPEWDMISRTFLGYSLANVAIQYPAERARAMQCLDRIIDDTAKVPWMDFLLDYGHGEPFLRNPPSSVMVDGEVSLLIGLRRLVEDPPDYPYRTLHTQLVERCIASMKDGPVLCGECYPDECWLWCNPLALASARVMDVLEGTDHSAFFREWEKVCREKIVDRKTGLIPSAIRLDGGVIHPPEGSTIWIGAYCLIPVCPGFAREQYDLMRRKMSGRLFFLAYGREWPKGEQGSWDIDSGFTPFGMGPASTGFALVASKEFNDRDFFGRLLTFLNIVGVPSCTGGRMRYLSSNHVGDTTFLLAKTTGAAWAEVARRSRNAGGPQ
jgi:hypothetical protein